VRLKQNHKRQSGKRANRTARGKCMQTDGLNIPRLETVIALVRAIGRENTSAGHPSASDPRATFCGARIREGARDKALLMRPLHRQRPVDAE